MYQSICSYETNMAQSNVLFLKLGSLFFIRRAGSIWSSLKVSSINRFIYQYFLDPATHNLPLPGGPPTLNIYLASKLTYPTSIIHASLVLPALG